MREEFVFLPEDVKRLFFSGIGGISMSSLAKLAKSRGYEVSGSDVGEGEKIDELKGMGIDVYNVHDAANLPKTEQNERFAFVYSAAIKEDNEEVIAARRQGALVFGRADFLGKLMLEYHERIGIAGMHGKSTVTAMLAEIYSATELDPTVLCGAVMSRFSDTLVNGSSDRLIFEACEYRDSFLSFAPTLAAVTNIDAEHLDYFRDEKAIECSFRKYIFGAKTAVLNIDDPVLRRIAASFKGDEDSRAVFDTRIITVSVYDRGADMYASDIRYYGGFAAFSALWHGKPVCNIRLRVPGKYNVSNALVAAATAFSDGVEPCVIEKALGDYRGIKRRMEYKGTYNGAVIYDDYAHHPTEIKAALSAAREMGFRFISCAFQPHTYSRTALLFCNFIKAFAEADEVLIADIYAAREENIYGITARDLACAMPNGYYLPTAELIAEHFKRIAAPGVLLLTMGAGRLDRVSDIILNGR